MSLHGTLRRLLVRRRICFAFGTVLTVSIMYICYQALSIRKLGEELSAEYTKRKGFHNSFQSYQKADFPVHLHKTDNHEETSTRAGILPRDEQFGVHGSRRIRGVLMEDVKRYIPDSHGNFRCIHSSEEISYSHVNDDYCDCQDGSDEPSTSACHNGRYETYIIASGGFRLFRCSWLKKSCTVFNYSLKPLWFA